MRAAIYQQRVARFFNKKVKIRKFKKGDLILRMILPGARNPQDGVLGPNWEGPFMIHEDLGNGAYHLCYMDGELIDRSWNAQHLRPYFQ